MVEISQNVENSRRRYAVTEYVLSFSCGILTASLILPGIPVILGSFLLSAVIVFMNRNRRRNFNAALLLVVFIGGMLDYSAAVRMESKLDTIGGSLAAYECLIMENPVERAGYTQYTAKCLSVIKEGKRYNFKEKVFIRLQQKQSFKFGDRIELMGRCIDFTGKRNPGDFDYRLYYKSKGITKIINAEAASLLEEDSAGILASMLYFSKEKVSITINQALPEEEAAMLVGIITGDKTDINEDTREAYTRTGLSHILSVSGLHVGFLMLMLTYILKPFRLERKRQGLIIFVTITYYILLIGAPLPSVRALIMLAVLMAGKALGRDYDLLASISFAGFLMLVIKPMAVHDPGFMISFGAMFAIALLYSSAYGIMKAVPAMIRNAAALSLAVWLGLAPVLAYYFNYISVISLIINIIAVPLSLMITIAGFIGVFAGLASRALSLYIFSVDYYLISLLTFITKKAAVLPFAGFHIPSLPVYIYALYYIFIGLAVSCFRFAFFKVYAKRVVLACLIAAVLATAFYNLPSKELKLVFFDVGQGDSCCIITPGKKVVLVDGGGSSGKGEYYYDVGGKVTLPALLHQGIWNIDTIVVSHMHDDHMEGLLKVLEVYSVKNLIIPKVSAGYENISNNSGLLLDLCRKKGTIIYRLGKGDRIRLESGISMDFLLPGEVSKTNENENSLVCKLTYGNFKALLTGDIGAETEKELASGIIEASVLKVPHHGSRLSSSEEFISGVKPKVSIVSVGRNNFGHPSLDVLERLQQKDSIVYRTDEAGAVLVTTDGNNLKVRAIRR